MLFYNIVTIYFFVMAITVVFWVAYVKSLSGANYTLAAVLLSIAVCLYMLGYALELNATSISQIMFWNKIEYFGIPYVSALWLTVSLMYSDNDRFQRRKYFWLVTIFLIPVITMVLRLTNDQHFLYFSSNAMIFRHGRLLFAKPAGPWMAVQAMHSMLMVLSALGILIKDSAESDDNKTEKIFLMVIASVFAITGLFLSIVKPFDYIIDYMALCLPISCLMVILAIVRCDFLETKSLARSKAFEASRDAMILVNRKLKIIDLNKSARLLANRIKADPSGQYEGGALMNAELLEQFRKQETTIVTLVLYSQESHYEISTQSIDDSPNPKGWIKTIRDVTLEHRQRALLERQAMMDDLSGLSNRRAFMQLGTSIMRRSEKDQTPVYLLMLDLDHFKKVNDDYGHQVGDAVIAYLGRALKKYFDTNSVCARLGGEEFGVLLYGFKLLEVKEMANLALKRIGMHLHYSSAGTFHVTVSIGVAGKNSEYITLEALMRKADDALYKSKSSGRNCVTFN